MAPITGYVSGCLGSVVPPTPVYLLDAIATAAKAAYSTRRLRSAYAGSALRVRRSSDNTEQDIGFTAGGLLDTTSLATFVTTNNGFITKWYDQSGNGLDGVQASAANQPQLVVTGTIQLLSGNPAIKFIEASVTHLDVTAHTNQVVSASAFTVLDAFSATTISSTVNTFQSNMHWSDAGFGNFEPIGCGGNPTFKILSQVASTGNHNPTLGISLSTATIGIAQLGGGNLSIYNNGGTPGTTACGVIDDVTGATTQQIGSNSGNTFLLDGFMTEIILYDVVLSHGDMNMLGNGPNILAGGNMSSYAGVTWTNI